MLTSAGASIVSQPGGLGLYPTVGCRAGSMPAHAHRYVAGVIWRSKVHAAWSQQTGVSCLRPGHQQSVSGAFSLDYSGAAAMRNI